MLWLAHSLSRHRRYHGWFLIFSMRMSRAGVRLGVDRATLPRLSRLSAPTFGAPMRSWLPARCSPIKRAILARAGQFIAFLMEYIYASLIARMAQRCEGS